MTDDWEGGERQGIRWRRVGLVLLVVAIVGGGIYAVRRERGISVETDGTPVAGATDEVEIAVLGPSNAGDRWYCPDTHPVRVHANGRYYPGEYPRGYDLLERPQSCYADAERAERDGFELAEPPADTVVAGGVYLEETSTPTVAACKEMSLWTDFPVPCPRRLPTPAIAASCGEDSCMYGGRDQTFGGQEGDFGVVIEQREFREPPDWPADSPHVVVSAVGVDRVARNGKVLVHVHPELVSCAADTTIANQREPVFVECPPGAEWIPRIQGQPHEEHTAAFWRRGRAVYAASVEGYGPQVRAVLDEVIDGIQYFDDGERV